MLTETSALTVDARSRRLRKVSAVVVMVLKLLSFIEDAGPPPPPVLLLVYYSYVYATVPRLRSTYKNKSKSIK